MRFYIFCFLAVFFLLPSCQKSVEAPLPDPYSEERSWFEYLCSEGLGGRYSGSDGIAATVDYICGIIGDSDSLYVDTFPTVECMMRNIVFHIDGEKDSTIVLGAHYDAFGYYNNTPLPGADDNMSGVAVLLKVIKAIQKNKIRPKYGIDFCFFDGEEIGMFGSTRYVSESKKGIKFYINVDTVGNSEVELAFLYSNDYLYLTEGFEGMIEDLNMSVAEYNPVEFATDCSSFKYNHIPFICMVCNKLPTYLHKPEDDVSKISFERLDIIAKGIERYLRLL